MRVVALLVLLLAAICLRTESAPSFQGIYTGLEGMRRAECHRLRNSGRNVQFPYYCKVGRVSVIGVIQGSRSYSISSNQLMFSGPVSRMDDVTFITEQDGDGRILAKFNGAILTCNGFSAMKRKSCVIPRGMRPWSGRITVEVFGSGGYNPSTGLTMSGEPYCPTAGFKGDNCDQDVDECLKYQDKDKQLCAWKPGCVNTIGSFICKCPPGYTISANDFRLCDKDIPKISSPASTITVNFMQTASLPCRHSATGPVIVKWQIGNSIIAVKQPNGAKQTIDSTRLILHDSGDLELRRVAYGDAGKFICVVQNAAFGAYVVHTLDVESAPLMDAQFWVSGNYTERHAYSTGDNVTMDCHVIAMPEPAISWYKGQQQVQTAGNVKVTLGSVPDTPLTAAKQLRLEISGVTQSDAGAYTCKASNKHGANTHNLALAVT
ncbi:predicted protein [Nematostella vectensis]|uniref:Ig-like domain-containing protein n=1 Tax=Nematostella vectensis TaxID=45351 RepID=A7RM46_NEMVE|nr:predicted protein [Nematostella vectensis]|eukprot:XP_001639603.1 predicted protein [Nematostella vectensis]